MGAFVVVIGHGPDLEAPEGIATLVRTLGADVRTLDLWEEGVSLFADPDARARAIVIEASERPDLAVLYISGHTGDELARRRRLDASVPFLQKPFPPDELVERVQELLERRAQGSDA